MNDAPLTIGGIDRHCDRCGTLKPLWDFPRVVSMKFIVEDGRPVGFGEYVTDPPGLSRKICTACQERIRDN